MQIAVHTLTSPVHDARAVNTLTDGFIDALRQALTQHIPDAQLLWQGEDFAGYGTVADLSLVFVRTGGTEGIFRTLLQTQPALRNARQPVLLLASGNSNSLAASMEILSFLRQQGRQGEIIHGTAAYMAERIGTLAQVERACRTLQGQRIGVIGQPSDWLIAGGIDKEALLRKAGISTLDITMDELLEEIARKDYPDEVRRRLRPLNASESRLPLEGALHIYGALCRLRDKYALSGLTLRCFDLLGTVRNTGCLALALLNSEGVPAACEGDIPALLSMMASHALTGTSGFQANPSRIDPEKGEILFAHCTVPLSMLTAYGYDTHFESGIGVAIRGTLPAGNVTVFKTDGAFCRYMATEGTLLHNGQEDNLCRTQVTLHVPDAVPCFLRQPVGNHHIIIPGHRKTLFDGFMQRINCTTESATE